MNQEVLEIQQQGPVLSEEKDLGFQQPEPVISEEKLFNKKNLFLAFLLWIIGLVTFIIIVGYFDLDFANSVITAISIIIPYIIILFFLLEPKILRKVHTKEIETIEKPVIRFVERPVFKEVIKEVEKPVFRDVVREVERPVFRERIKKIFIEKPREILNIPRYKYRGSTETKTYHKTSCRLSKLIKRKYKISKNSPLYFTRRGFKPCKTCLPNKKTKNKNKPISNKKS